MMANKKEQERTELHKTIWQIANQLRGSVDGWEFKQYVLGAFFHRFISESLVQYINNNEHRDGRKNFDYIKLLDKQARLAQEQAVQEKSFFILPSELFVNVSKIAALQRQVYIFTLSTVKL